MATPNINKSGDGSRPTTDGGVDNIGAAGTFTPRQADPDTSGPSPKEKMHDTRRKDDDSVKEDDSAPFGLNESNKTQPNTEHPHANPSNRDVKQS